MSDEFRMYGIDITNVDISGGDFCACIARARLMVELARDDNLDDATRSLLHARATGYIAALHQLGVLDGEDITKLTAPEPELP